MKLEICEINTGKRAYLGLLLLGDEQESMIDRYIDRGELFVLTEGEATAGGCVVTDEGGGVCELKNIAVCPQFRGRGYGRALVEYVCRHYAGRFRTMLAGTGEVPSILRFYEGCGFAPSHRIAGFFTGHYDHPIVEEGVLLRDMVYLKKEL